MNIAPPRSLAHARVPAPDLASQAQAGGNAGSLRDFAARHPEATVIVCGCGTSLTADVAEQAARHGWVTIGVNDVGRLFTPDYLVVLNPPRQFRGDRFTHVRNSQARALFTQLAPQVLGPVNPPLVRITLGANGGTEVGADGSLPHTQNSPYVAVCLAVLMGARRIGLIGVDFTEDHFFARSGRHPLSARLARIDQEYGALAQALKARGVELVNLSPVSRLHSLPRLGLSDFAGASAGHAMLAAASNAAPSHAPDMALATALRPRRVFVVNYRFLTCGEVFADGLRHAAQALGLAHDDADWDDPRLPEKIAAFQPDLLLVVHGRRFVQRWGDRFGRAQNTPWHSAVWLVDEPYEVDDTASWSHHFDTVFVNDPVTLQRHQQHPRHQDHQGTHEAAPTAHALPMAFDPVHCHDVLGPRRHRVGFIGGSNPTRERMLLRLADAGLLSYVVGGPWRSPVLQRLCLAKHVPHAQTAALYQQTDIVINVFRDQHHFNAQGLVGQSLNPRVVEALACGALVVSEPRSELLQHFPELPVFDGDAALVSTVQRLLADRTEHDRVLAACRARLSQHRYQDRLQVALNVTLNVTLGQAHTTAAPASAAPAASDASHAPHPVLPAAPMRPALRRPPAALPDLSARTRVALNLQPLVAAPKRHLLYHLWPVRGSTWRWNVEQLLRRIDLFNGRRIVAIVSDERTEDIAVVRAAFAGHGVSFIERPNNAQGESDTFPLMLAEMAREHPDDLSFYAHAKGVKYEPHWPPAVRRWAEVQYAVALDRWPEVRAHLERHAMTGLLRRMGRYANHGHVGDWHYSGTFFWFRHDAVFRRAWQDVPRFYGGVEAWPGMLFASQETSCLLLDGLSERLRDLPYHERFWQQRGNPAFAQWQRGQRPLPPPPDLLHPAPFDGEASPRLEQRPEEFAWWLDRLFDSGAQRLLVVAPAHDGVAVHVQRAAARHGRAIEVLHLPRADALPAGSRIDAAFIDGEHSYAACRRDVDAALAAGARLLALHDIVDSDWHAASRCCVSRVWAELTAQHPQAQARMGSDWGGIGLVEVAGEPRRPSPATHGDPQRPTAAPPSFAPRSEL